jgi:hypothetical protein
MTRIDFLKLLNQVYDGKIIPANCDSLFKVMDVKNNDFILMESFLEVIDLME